MRSFLVDEGEIIIRKATLKDVEEILRIAKSFSLDIPDFVWSTEDFVRQQIDRGEYYLAVKEGKAVGIISFRQRGKKMYIETLSVVREHRASGIGKHLIEFAKRFTKKRGLRKLVACSFYEYDAKDFYLKQGFFLLWRRGRYNGHKFYRFEVEV